MAARTVSLPSEGNRVIFPCAEISVHVQLDKSAGMSVSRHAQCRIRKWFRARHAQGGYLRPLVSTLPRFSVVSKNPLAECVDSCNFYV